MVDDAAGDALAGKLRRAEKVWRKALPKKLKGGFDRVVFAAPQGPAAAAEPEVHPGPGRLGADDSFDFDEVFEKARDAAARGLVKHTWVLDDTQRLEVDMRHGYVKRRKLDAQSIDKIMGGKQRPLRPDRSAALLRAIGIMNADGSIPARRAKKYKQVNHLVELARPSLAHAAAKTKAPGAMQIVDLACGNGYLSFVLAETLRLEDEPVRLLGVDARQDLVDRCRERAETLGFDEMRFVCAKIRDAGEQLPARVDLLVALHACDTATDEAIVTGIALGASAMMIVPCCQAELARALDENSGPSSARQATIEAPVPALVQHGRFRRAYADLLTDALRVEALEAAGYEVTVVEFVSTEHSAKNTMLRAHRRGRGDAEITFSADALASLRARVDALGVRLSLVDQLEERFG